jgi:hypothetical protein
MNHLAGEDRLPQTPTETLTIRATLGFTGRHSG